MPTPFGLGYAEELKTVRALRAALGDAGFESSWEQGHQLSREAAIRLGSEAYALTDPKVKPSNRKSVESAVVPK